MVEVRVHPVVEQDAHDGGGHASDDDHAPQTPGAAALVRGLRAGEGVELREVQDDDGHDGADLDDHEEEREEFGSDVELHEFVHQDHVSGG